MARKLIIFEGALCCSTGICGPEPDRALIQLNEDVKRLKAEFPQDSISRASLSFNAGAFLEHPEINKLVNEEGTEVLPITSLNGKILSKQRYMTYDEMKAALLGAE
jgi:hypothetical protein